MLCSHASETLQIGSKMKSKLTAGSKIKKRSKMKEKGSEEKGKRKKGKYKLHAKIR